MKKQSAKWQSRTKSRRRSINSSSVEASPAKSIVSTARV